MKVLFLALLTSFSGVSLAATDWDGLINQSGGSRVYFGVAVEGPDPYRRNFSESFAPASNSKLFTAAALLDALGGEFRYVTYLRWIPVSETVATRVRLVGNGDPSWGMSELGDGLRTKVNAFADELKAAGVRTIQGEVEAVAGDERWNTLTFPTGWKSSDPISCGGALGQSFNLNINCATLVVSGTNKYRWQEGGVPTPVRLNVRAGRTTNLSVALDFFDGGQMGYRVDGTYKSGSRSFFLPVWNVRLWIQNLFLAALKERGIALVPSPGGPPLRNPEREISFPSPPLSTLLKPFLKNSVNVMGDSFLKTLALTEEFPLQPDLLALGLVKMREYLLRIGVPDEFHLYDGSGLSRLSRVTPAMMLTFLERNRGADFPALWEALPIAGIDGTLRNRMKGTAAAGVLRAKTGTLDGVYNLSGYVPDGNSFVPFLVLTRTTTANAGPSRAAGDRVGARLAQLLRVNANAPLGFLPTSQNAPFPYVPEHAGMDDQ